MKVAAQMLYKENITAFHNIRCHTVVMSCVIFMMMSAASAPATAASASATAASAAAVIMAVIMIVSMLVPVCMFLVRSLPAVRSHRAVDGCLPVLSKLLSDGSV